MHAQASSSPSPHSGRRRAVVERKSRGPYLYLVSVVLGALISTVAWVYLVRAAIDFGRTAMDGRAPAWAFAGAATIGATVCLLLVFALLHRGLRALGWARDLQAPRYSGRRVK